VDQAKLSHLWTNRHRSGKRWRHSGLDRFVVVKPKRHSLVFDFVEQRFAQPAN
jgi:hypothetical protein